MLRSLQMRRPFFLLSIELFLVAVWILSVLPSALMAGERELNTAKQYFLDAANNLAIQGADQEAIIEMVNSQLATIRLSRGENKNLIAWGLATPAVRLVSEAWYRVEVQQEKRAAEHDDPTDRSTFGFFMLNNEMRHLVRPTREDRILFIGSGPLPSMMHIANATESKIALCDCDSEAINISKCLIERHGMTERFDFIHSYANDIRSFADYNIIWIAVMVPNKLALMEEIAKTATPGTKIILRQATGPMQLFILPYEATDKANDFILHGTTMTGSCESRLFILGAPKANIWKRIFPN